MKKHFLIVVIALLLVVLAACIQSSRQSAQPSTPVSVAEVITTGTNAAQMEEAAKPAMLKISPTVSPTVQPSPTNTVVPTAVNKTPLPPVVSGMIQNADGPVAGAIVQVQGAPKQVKSGKDGSFQIDGLSGTTPAIITAWTEGHYVGWIAVNPSAPDWKGSNALKITLKPVPQSDNLDYPWFSFGGVQGSASCGLCHREYDEWKADAHSQAATNFRFLSMYKGTNAEGKESQPVKWGEGGKALPADPSKPYYGPGFQLDTPNRAGNCATCHTPVASKVSNQKNCGWSGCHTDLTIERSNGIITPNTRPVGLTGDGAEGITCDYCHKVGEVDVDPHTRLPKPDMPGILSMQLHRPQDGQQVFYGTLVDVNRRVSYSPLESQSEFCAPCHYGVFGGVVGVGKVTGGTVIYNSYGEWLNSPYSDAKSGKTCQQCHMQVSDANYFVFPEMGGHVRDYDELHNHYMPGAADADLLKNTVKLDSTAQRSGDQLSVKVSITNTGAGHDVPTDSPNRQMILVVEATDANGSPLALKAGPVNPDWAGNFAGQPGKTFMKLLRDEWTGETPTGAYWRPITVVEDTRLAALATDTQQFTFSLPAGVEATIHVQVIFRRTFQTLAQQKGWNDPDILMQEATLTIKK
jgi:hypothetical protein